MTSPDGTTWTARTAAEANSWERVVWAPSLALFAAVAADGTNRVMTSPDGITWTSRTAAAASNWYGLAWAPSLALFAAVSQGGLAMTSPDGITWTSRTPSAANGWTAVAWAPELGLFLAVAFSGTGRVMTSTDGILWLDRSVTIDKSWRGVTWSATLGTFVVVSDQASAMRNATVPALTGVTGLALAMQKGTPVAIWVKRNDTAAQTALALFEGGDGIREYLIVDQRRGEASLTAVCDADLAKFSRPLTSVTYATNDPLTRSGKTVSISLAIGTWDVMFDPAVFGDVIWGESGDFTIQDVTITFDAPGAYPRYTVTAASVNFTLADLLARLALAA
jgi:hypothetical protein